jgi:hypothetical protein
MRRPFLATVLFAATVGTLSTTPGNTQQRGVGQIASVIELYTSQGCSSCPAADQLLKSYLGRDDVLALSLNVDIWDKLGWKDTLARPEYTQRQRQYARTRGDGNVYTPQAVINGMAHAVGSDRTVIDDQIKSTGVQKQGMTVPLSFKAESNALLLEVPAWPNAPLAAVTATLWLIKLTPRVEVTIERGENAGRTIAYHNVVRAMNDVGSWRGSPHSIRLSRTILDGCTPGTCAVLLQQGGTGSILGAAWVPPSAGI